MAWGPLDEFEHSVPHITEEESRRLGADLGVLVPLAGELWHHRLPLRTPGDSGSGGSRWRGFKIWYWRLTTEFIPCELGAKCLCSPGAVCPHGLVTA